MNKNRDGTYVGVFFRGDVDLFCERGRRAAVGLRDFDGLDEIRQRYVKKL